MFPDDFSSEKSCCEIFRLLYEIQRYKLCFSIFLLSLVGTSFIGVSSKIKFLRNILFKKKEKHNEQYPEKKEQRFASLKKLPGTVNYPRSREHSRDLTDNEFGFARPNETRKQKGRDFPSRNRKNQCCCAFLKTHI
ncbi:uncharacterized protein LOC105662250 isoform X1 [Megachile rotundata]|uniref:uncharacterized protein LOC105662250 isoform X1 n=1 Tax=Megachile rotundata TaxID=143995 RepID=UPI003FCF2BD4